MARISEERMLHLEDRSRELTKVQAEVERLTAEIERLQQFEARIREWVETTSNGIAAAQVAVLLPIKPHNSDRP